MPRPLAPCLLLALALAASAQTGQPKPELLLYHPTAPFSYEVATIKPVDSDIVNSVRPTGGSAVRLVSTPNLRRYIMNAYGAAYSAQIVGGPDWLDKATYDVKGKVPDDLEAAQQSMTSADRQDQTRAMQQSLLADRFHLKAHFETRVLPVYELVPAKGGLKITEVPAPPEHKPGDPPMRIRPNDPLPPGAMRTMFKSDGLRVLDAGAIQMQMLGHILGPDAGDRPVVDHTGFTGYFDVKALTWAPVGDANAADTPDAPSLTGALEKQLGLKLVPAKDPIEVLVIDSIDHPTEN